MPFSFCPSSAHCHAMRPVATTGTVETAASRRLKYAAATKGPVFRPQREIVERHGGDEQRNREVNQHHMLCVFGEKHSFDVEGIDAHRFTVGLGEGPHCTTTLPVIFG